MTDPIVTIRPMVYGDRRYVYATSRRAVIAQLIRDETARASMLHERHLDFQIVRDLVDHLIADCDTRIANVAGVGDEDGQPAEIQGFIVEAPADGTIEFLHLRETYREMSSSALAASVVAGLVNGRKDLVLRRHTSPTTMLALLATNAKVTVRPRGI